MARLCVRIVPNPNPSDPAMDDLRTQEGDVVFIVDDSHVFSHAELNCGHYRIIDVPGIPQEDLIHLMDSEYEADGKMKNRRIDELDKAILKSPEWIGKRNATKAEIAAIKKKKR